MSYLHDRYTHVHGGHPYPGHIFRLGFLSLAFDRKRFRLWLWPMRRDLINWCAR